MSIFNIGKANERIAALEAELKKAKDDAKTATDAAAENAKQVEEAADALKKERDEIKVKFDAEASAHTATKQLLEKANADLKTAKDEIAALPEKIKAEGSKVAQQINASLGVPPIQATPAATPAATPKTELKGIEKARAAFRAQFEKNKE